MTLRALVLMAVALVVVPNAVFAVAQHYLYVPRALINVDYLLAGALALWLPAITGVVLLAAVGFVDIVLTVAPSFHFRPAIALEAIGNVFEWDAAWGALTALPVGGGLLAVGATMRALLPAAGLRNAAHTLVSCAAALALVLADRALPALAPTDADGRASAPVNLATSPMLRVARFAVAGTPRAEALAMSRPVAAATQPLFDALDAGTPLPGRVVVVMVESLGRFSDPQLDQLQWQSLDDPAILARYERRAGEVPFEGSTVPAELRELCRAKLDAYPRTGADVASLDCLPARFAAAGYRAVAVHGFAASMFNRIDWYPGIGFGDLVFSDRLRDGVPRRACGRSFRGLCDADVGNVVSASVVSPGAERHFVFWLTLNAHAPQGSVPEDDTSLRCDHPALAGQPEVVCDLLRFNDIVLRSVARIARDAVDPPVIVVVGDHAPHFLSQALRARFDQQRVPWVVLWPKAIEP